MSDVVTKLPALYEQGVIDGVALNASLKLTASTSERPTPAPRVKPTPAPRPAVERPKPIPAPRVKLKPAQRPKPIPAPRLKPTPAPRAKPTPAQAVGQPQLTFKQRGHAIKDMLWTWEIPYHQAIGWRQTRGRHSKVSVKRSNGSSLRKSLRFRG